MREQAAGELLRRPRPGARGELQPSFSKTTQGMRKSAGEVCLLRSERAVHEYEEQEKAKMNRRDLFRWSGMGLVARAASAAGMVAPKGNGRAETTRRPIRRARR